MTIMGNKMNMTDHSMLQYVNQSVIGMDLYGIRNFTALAVKTPDVCMLTIGEPDFNTSDEIKEAAKLALDENNTHYSDGNGYYYLRKAISEFEKEKHGLSYEPEEIIVTLGATEAVFSSLYTILNPGDEVIIPTPAFSLYESVVQLCNAVPIMLPTEETNFQITKAALQKVITPKTKALVLTSPNNPTGCIYTKETLDGIHEVLRDLPVFVLCDEVYRQLIYTGEYHSFAEYEDMRDRTIVVQSFSKPYAMTGWRVGYVMADAMVIDRIQIWHQYAVVAAPSFIQPACVAALKSDNTAMVETLKCRMEYTYHRLVGMGLEVQKPEGAFYFFVNIKKFGMDSLDFCKKLLQEARVAIVPGCYFGTEGYARLSYCCEMDRLKQGLDRLECFIDSYKAQHS